MSRRIGLGAMVAATLVLALAGCVSQPVSHVTPAEFLSGIRPVPQQGNDAVAGVPRGGVLLFATVTDVRTTPRILVELSDPSQEAHIWVTGFAEPPDRGVQVWTAIVGPPVPDNLVIATYPTVGLLPAPKGRTGVTARGALGILVGGVALVALLTCCLVAVVADRSRSRRCLGCAQPVDPRWATCPRCGHSLVSPPALPAEMRTA